MNRDSLMLLCYGGVNVSMIGISVVVLLISESEY